MSYRSEYILMKSSERDRLNEEQSEVKTNKVEK